MPAYDELLNLRVLIPDIIKNVALIEHEIKIFPIVRNHANNAELIELKQLGSHPIRRSPSDSFGDAIRTGLKVTKNNSDYIIIMDADGSHPPSTISRLISTAISSNADIVIASRYIRGGSSDNKFFLKLMSKILNSIYSLVLGIRVKDISTNFKIYKSNLIDEKVLKCDDYDIVEELLLSVKNSQKNTFNVVEIPDRFHDRLHGESKRKLFIFIYSYLVTLIRLRLRK
jgi:dolichol-phosphate mannosyltransferase